MKFLVLAYGREEDWAALSRPVQQALLAADEMLRDRGDLVAAVDTETTVVRAWTGEVVTTRGPFAAGTTPLAGFGIIDADSLAHAVSLVADTPCARANGAVEIRAIVASNDDARRLRLGRSKIA